MFFNCFVIILYYLCRFVVITGIHKRYSTKLHPAIKPLITHMSVIRPINREKNRRIYINLGRKWMQIR